MLTKEPALGLYLTGLSRLRSALDAIDGGKFSEAEHLLASFHEQCIGLGNSKTLDEHQLNEVFLFSQLVHLLEAYAHLWQHIAAGRFEKSWNALQDCMDYLRTMKRFGGGDFSWFGFFERQLSDLEDLYPYRIFCSVGGIARVVECSICGRDIDSDDDCTHLRGELYAGRMAVAIIREMEIDHIAATDSPANKRCVPLYGDSSDHFDAVRHIKDSFHSYKLSPMRFAGIVKSKRKVPRSEFPRTGRNAPCVCGSGKKFKKCCISVESLETDHLDVLLSEDKAPVFLPELEPPTRLELVDPLETTSA